MPLPLPFAVRFRRLYVRARPEPQVVPAHRHDDLELILISRGSWRGRIDGEELVVPSGSALLVAPGDRHEDRCHAPVALFGVSLDLLPGPQPGRSASPLRPGAAIASRVLQHADALMATVERLHQATVAGGDWSSHLQDAIAHELVVRLLAALPPAVVAEEAAARIASAGLGTALAELFTRHPGGLPVPALARALGLGERAFQQRCRRLLGTSPAELQRRHRLALAQELLGAGLPVQAVAARLGFANPFHFSTAYKRSFGHPPSRSLRD